ncbi:MAG TPA: uroporphyrinogen-III C-methyltransferase [Acidimicrobiales bacterium]|nr:uroporphyrinogen-III C-methyltransferase [Acidimicrobiales bacterium]
MTVYLVGAGPGDPGLLTLRGAELLGRADVVVHDRLAEAQLLDLAPAAAERIDVGKQPGRPVAQEYVNELLVERGLAGMEVVRLKGGDPFVFGRGGEEALALLEAGVPFEVVPGVTSAVAAPAYAGVPLTHRGLSTSFTVVTGHSRPRNEGLQTDRGPNWEALAAAGGTIVVLMGVSERPEYAARLRAGGLPGTTPVLCVHWGTRPQQRSVRTTLAELPEVALEPPATIVIGEVAALDLSWFERRPLFGRRIVVTRPPDQAPALVRALRGKGAETVVLPVIAITDPADGGADLRAAAEALNDYDWVVFTSANAVERLVALLPDARSFGAARIAAIGTGTAAALAAARLVPDLVPDRFVAESLLEAFSPPAHRGSRVLLPAAAAARQVLPEGLRARGYDVHVVEAYRTQPGDLSPAAMAEAAGADAIAFTSSSTVTEYLAVAGADTVPPVVACIGPVTSATARENGLTVAVEAGVHTVRGLVDALEQYFGGS